jgi:two-component system chemotaxis response regulator CheY
MPSGKQVTILLVEDDEVDVKALRWAFDKLKIANPVAVARDGVEALELLGKLARPFLIITDINMPRMDGFGFMMRVRALPLYRATPILVLSTESSDEKKSRARSMGATGWIVKPFNADTLLNAVRRVAG